MLQLLFICVSSFPSQRFKGAENKISDQFNVITSLREELESLKTSLLEEKDARRTLQAEADSSRSQFLDIQRAERVVRVDLEETKRTVRYLHNYSTLKSCEIGT